MQTTQELDQQFHQDLDRIAGDLINLYGLRYRAEIDNLSTPLLRWLDFSRRYIPPRPRQIFLSLKFPNTLDPDVQESLFHIESLIRRGSDINPYQSKGLILHNDTSAAKRQQRTDLLWADWGIHHLHLTTTPLVQKNYFANRSQWLLFCLVGPDFICLIDIRNHAESELFSDINLIKTVYESWPDLLDKYRIKGKLVGTNEPTAAEIMEMRKGGVSAFLTFGENVYMSPGMGVTAASTPSRISMDMVHISHYLKELAKMVSDPIGQFKIETEKSGILDPEFSLGLTRRGLAIYEEKENKAFVLPREQSSFLGELHDLVVPYWAVDYLLKTSM